MLRTFNQLHDGIINSISSENYDILIGVDIVYLAERINSEYCYLHIRLINCNLLTFKAWSTNEYIEIENIHSLELEINKAEFVSDHIEVSCLCDGSIVGGDLIIKASKVRIYDEKYNEIPINDFDEIVKGYWKGFNKDFDK